MMQIIERSRGGTATRTTLLLVLAAFALAAGFTCEVHAALTLHKVSQRHRAFDPTTLTIEQGDTIEVVNDDGDLQHHAYVKSPSFSFDSGEQDPGTKVDIVFPVAGNFTILCGIHPRMHLEVTVR